jgi:polyhydroxyalkanoate synthase subunit PhaC
VELAPSPKDVLFRDAGARVYRFRSSSDRGRKAPGGAKALGIPLLLVPSLINRWYVLDLRARASLVEALIEQGIDVFCLDWGVPEDEDRYLTWEHVLAKLARAARFVKREARAQRLGLLGYCMGGTLAAILAALFPDDTALLVNLAGPIDFSEAGVLRQMVDARWFDAGAIADAGNIGALQMQSGFTALRPTLSLAKWVNYLDRGHDPAQREAFDALEAWSSDNVPFPAEAYRTYITELYQRNRIMSGEHYVAGKRVLLRNIRCPVLTIVAEQDAICPPAAAIALNAAVGSTDTSILSVPGGHVGAVVGSRASRELYPRLTTWLAERLLERS